MSKISWVGHSLSSDPTFPRAYVASILNPSITNFWLHHWVNAPHKGWFAYPEGIEGWVDLGGWLQLHIVSYHTRPQTVTHPSINRARGRVTTLIKTKALSISQATCQHLTNWQSRIIMLRDMFVKEQNPTSVRLCINFNLPNIRATSM